MAKNSDHNLTSNVSNTTTNQQCLLTSHGCKSPQESMLLKEHYSSEEHQKTLVRLAKQLIEKDNLNIDAEENADQFHTHYDNLSISIQNIEDIHKEVLSFDSDIIQMSNHQSSVSESIADMKAESLLEKSHIEAAAYNQQVLSHDFTSIFEEMKSRNSSVKHSVLDGTMIWKITNIREKMYDAQSERQLSIYSPAFYTSETGYNLCARLYLNGDGAARGTHVSIFLVILRGDYDALLKWPFSYRVSFCLFDQRTMIESGLINQARHIIESFRPDTNSISFQRPRSAINIASGIPKFCPLNILNQPSEINRYIINDTMYIKVLIDFIGISRTILPFIFNLNIAFPVQIQQKLIEDEIKRREEENLH